MSYVKASEEIGDPVGHIDGDWGFWDETWSNWNGGYETEQEARAALELYCERYL